MTLMTTHCFWVVIFIVEVDGTRKEHNPSLFPYPSKHSDPGFPFTFIILFTTSLSVLMPTNALQKFPLEPFHFIIILPRWKCAYYWKIFWFMHFITPNVPMNWCKKSYNVGTTKKIETVFDLVGFDLSNDFIQCLKKLFASPFESEVSVFVSP